MDDASKELLKKMTGEMSGAPDDVQRLEWLQDQIQAYGRYLPSRVIEKIKIDPKAKRIEGERRTVTIAFADLSGFTALSETMDAEDIAGVINQFFDRMVKIVFKYGGSVDKFLGDALMVLFGAPVAHHDDPERAVRACLDMQEEMNRFNAEKKFDPPLGMSIGVNTGPVVALNVGSDERMEYTVIGDAVNLAARLEAVSTRGETIISNFTYEKVSDVIEAERRPSVRVKGKRKPIVIYLVKGVRERYVMPEFSRLPLVGRSAELARVRLCLDHAIGGQPALIGVTGDPGSGKTRLAAEIESDARHRNFTVLAGRCVSYEINHPYVLFRSLLHDFFKSQRDAASEEKKLRLGLALKNAGANLEQALPYLGILLGLEFPEIAALPPEELKKRIYAAVKDLFMRLAGAAPLLLHIDDVQWADPSSIELLGYLIDGLAGHRIVVFCAYRSDFNFPWLANPHFHGMVLPNFSAEETSDFAQKILKVTDLPDELSQAVREKSQGNPLFIEEILKLLVRKGGIRRSRDAVQITERFRKLEIAESVSSVILDQIDRLDETEHRLLQYASVIGRTFRPELLSALLGLPGSELTDKLERLVHFEGLLAEQSERHEFEFISPTTYEVVYGSLFKTRRRQLHGLIGRELERMFADRIADQVEALAYHFSRSDDPKKGIEFLDRAAEKTFRLFALRETIAYFDMALELLPKNDAVRQAEIRERQGWTYKLSGDFAAAMKRLKQALKYARQADSLKLEAKSAINLGIVSHEMGQSARGLNYFLKTRRTARELGDRLIEASAIQNIGVHYLKAGQWDKAYEEYRVVLEIYEAHNNRQGVARAHHNIGIIMQNKGDLEKALEHFENARRTFQEIGDKDWLIKCDHYIGHILLNRGDAAAAEALFEEALSNAVNIGDRSQEALMLGNIGLIRAQAWDLNAALEKFARSMELARTVGDAHQTGDMSINVGDVHLFQGNLALAIENHSRTADEAGQCKDPIQEALARRSLGWDHYYQAEFKKSQADFEISRDLYLQVGDRRNAVISSLGITMAGSRLTMGDALQTEISSLEEKARSRQDLEILGLILDIKTDIQFRFTDYSAVKALSDELLEIAKKTNNKRLFAWALARMGRSMIKLDNIEAGRISLNKADGLVKALGDQILSIYCTMVQAEIAEKTSESDASKKTYAEAWELTKKTGAVLIGLPCLYQLAAAAAKVKKSPAVYIKEYNVLVEKITAGLSAEEKKTFLKTIE